jgi:hypothetical protein
MLFLNKKFSGQIIPPPHYLSEVYRHVREAGGVCIADEVQAKKSFVTLKLKKVFLFIKHPRFEV